MKKINKSLPILILLIIGLASTAYGACTFVNPSGSADILKGTEVLNVTCGATDDAVNCTIVFTSSASGDTATVNLYNHTDSGLNATYVTTALNDAADWGVTGTCVNSSSQSYTITALTSFDVDNTVPAITGCTMDGSSASNGTISDSTLSSVCDIRYATSCNVYWKDNTANAMTTDYPDADCAFTATSSFAATTEASCTLLGAGDNYDTWYYDCTDGLNTTTGTHYEAKQEAGYSAAQRADRTSPMSITGDGTQTTNKQLMFFLIVASAAVVLVIVYLYIQKKK